MTTTIDWVHEIDASFASVEPPTAYVRTARTSRWRRHHPTPSTTEAFTGFVDVHGPQVRRLAHAVCCDWAQAEALTAATLTGLYDEWHRLPNEAAVWTRVHRALARAVVTDSPMPRSCTAHGDDYPIEDESLLFDGLQSLGVVQRKALILHHWLDVPADEVAGLLGITVDQVLLHTARGRVALNVLLPSSA